MHERADGHETLVSEAVAPGIRGVDCADQREPFQCATYGWVLCGLVVRQPTAVHDLDEEHDTPMSRTFWVATGAGRIFAWICHRLPSQRSIRPPVRVPRVL
jgi:hypothetical protein